MTFAPPKWKIAFHKSLASALLLVAALFCFSASVAHATNQPVLISHLNDSPNDSSVNQFTATSTSISYSIGKLSDAIDITNGNISYGNNLNQGTSSFSVSAWIKSSNTTGTYQEIIGKSTASCQSEWDFRLDDNGKIQFLVCDSGINNYVLGTTDLRNGNWHHVIGIRGANPNGMHVYVDDVSQASTTNNVETQSNSLNLKIGQTDSGTYPFSFKGKIDEVNVFNYEISSSTIDTLWNAGTGCEMQSDGNCITAISLSSPHQYEVDATTTIANGNKIVQSTSTVVFGANLQSTGTSTLQLQVEVRPAGTSFTNTSTTASGFVSPGNNATATAMNLAPGTYHWQARVLESGTNNSSTWKLFGLSTTTTDFIVDPAESAYFDGSSAWKWPATKLGFNSTDPFTIEFYYKTTSTSSAMQLLDTRTSGKNGFAVWKDAGDGGAINFSLDCGGDATGTTAQLSGARGIHNAEAEGYWHHVAVSKKSTASSTDAFKLYFDGAQQTGGQCYTSTSTDSIWVPGNPSSSINLFKGNIDELRIWKTERSVSDIAAYSLAEVTSTDSNLLGYWRFNGTSTDLVTQNATSGQSANPIFSTSTPFGHFLLRDNPDIRPWTSVNTSTYGLLWYNSSTQYLAQWVAGANTWNASTSHSINIASTTATSSANLIVDDVNLPSSGFLARWNNLVGPPQEIQYNTPKLAGYSSTTLQHISTHELGHALGLAHSLFGDIMYAYSDAASFQTTLGLQDKNDYEFLWAR